MPTLLIDNHDSYTFNLYQLLARVAGEDPVVVRNDELAWGELADEPWDRIVVSPGPGRPERERDLGIGRDALAQHDVPVLGVCLGHQGLAHVRGASIVSASEIIHGRISPIFHRGEGLFSGIPQGFRAVRYHSLVVEPALPPELEAIGWSDDGTVMAIRVRRRPAWGVQFHPESVGTEHGERLIENFVALTPPRRRPRPRPVRTATVPAGPPPRRRTDAVRIAYTVAAGAVDGERAFAALFADRETAFWLDSSLVDAPVPSPCPASREASGCDPPGERVKLSRFSFMGAAAGSLGAEVRYDVRQQRVDVEHAAGGGHEHHDETLFAYLARELARLHTVSPQLPFDLNGGFVGYLGYELKADCGAADAHRAELPDAFLLLADRIVAIDHERDETHVLALADETAAGLADADRWVRETQRALTCLAPLEDPPRDDDEQVAVAPRLTRSREHYLANIEACKRLLEAGESYEICLTNRVALGPVADTFALYRVLRRVNPAPYSAYLRMREGAVLSSSPERFLRVRRDRSVETKPIKGTARRRRSDPLADNAARDDLLRSAKDRAEHLMIVDLLRNDLGRVSQIGSVYVAKLMDVESYESVHQMVSTIRGLLRDDVDLADLLRATFPGGSMTGAPKLRTMEIIDALEGSARGVYSGALGYLALNGTADLSIVIRTLVATPRGASIGSGGAVVMLSEARDEYEEMLLKVQPLLDAVRISGALRQPPTAEAVRGR